VLRWPARGQVQAALAEWADACAPSHPELLWLGIFGSFARGDWGVGSDLDLVALVTDADLPFERRAVTWPLERLPVPADLLVYTTAEWQCALADRRAFVTRIERDLRRVWPRTDAGTPPGQS
jgi:Nucleotidyltransferase domain